MRKLTWFLFRLDRIPTDSVMQLRSVRPDPRPRRTESKISMVAASSATTSCSTKKTVGKSSSVKSFKVTAGSTASASPSTSSGADIALSGTALSRKSTRFRSGSSERSPAKGSPNNPKPPTVKRLIASPLNRRTRRTNPIPTTTTDPKSQIASKDDNKNKFDTSKEKGWRNPIAKKQAEPVKRTVDHSNVSVSIEPPVDEESLSGFAQESSERNISSSNTGTSASSGNHPNQLEANAASKCISECDSTTDYEQDLTTTNSSTPILNVVLSTTTTNPAAVGECAEDVHQFVGSVVDSTTDMATSDPVASKEFNLPSILQSCSLPVDV